MGARIRCRMNQVGARPDQAKSPVGDGAAAAAYLAQVCFCWQTDAERCVLPFAELSATL